MKDSRLIFSFIRTPTLGLTLESFLVKLIENETFSYEYQRVNYERRGDYDYPFSEDELAILAKTSELSVQHIEKIFNPKKLKREVFLERLAKDEVQMKRLSEFFDHRLAFCLDKLRGQTVYWRDKQSDHPSLVKSFVVAEEPVTTLFHFRKSEAEIVYTFQASRADGSRINLQHPANRIISSEPGWFATQGEIFSLPKGVTGQKLMPFTKKTEQIIPDKLAEAFMSSFLIRTTRRAEVQFEGFEVRSAPNSTRAVLSVTPDLDHKPVLQLDFHYDDFIVNAAQKQELLARIDRSSGTSTIVRYFRITEWERNTASFLTQELQMEAIAQSLFLPSHLRNEEYTVEQVLEWLSEHHDQLRAKGISVFGRWKQKDFVTSKAVIRTQQKKKEEDWFDLHVVVLVDGISIPFVRFRNHIIEKNRYFNLPNGRVFLLPESWFIQFADLFEFGELDQDSLRLHRQHQSLIEGHPLLSQGIQLGLNNSQKKVYTESSLSQYPLPKGLNATLRDYQRKGFNWLASMHENKLGACLADDMGLGKTLQVICLLLYVTEKERERLKLQPAGQLDLFGFEESRASGCPHLVVMSPTLLHNWEREISRFAPGLRVIRHAGSKRSSDERPLLQADVILTTYGVVRNDKELLQRMEFNYVVLDESQLIKNMRSASFQSVRTLKSENRIVLTGTPVENSLTDLWSQLTFLQPGLLGTFHFFKGEFVIPIEQNNDDQKLEKLQKLVRPFILRRTKQEVAPELPDQTRILNYSVMEGEQKKVYEERKSYYRNLILETVEKSGLQNNQMLILRGLTQLRQIAIHPLLENPEYIGDSAKFRDVMTRLEELASEGRKVLIFSQFVKHLEIYRKAFDEHQLPYSWLTGGVPMANRGRIIDEFDHHEGFRAFLIQTKTGGAGLNLTKADCVFLLDPWWNPALEEQAISRSHRIGQKQQVFVWRFITQDSIEEKIMRLQERKAKLALDLMSRTNPLIRLSQEELEELFG